MRWTKTLFALTALIGTSLLLAADDKLRAFQFGKDDVGKVPMGWKVDKTGKGDGSVWNLDIAQSGPTV